MNVNMNIVSLILKINSMQQNDNVTVSQQAHKIFLVLRACIYMQHRYLYGRFTV